MHFLSGRAKVLLSRSVGYETSVSSLAGAAQETFALPPDAGRG